MWMRKAEHDLEAAARIMAVEENCPFDTVCFHCQQTADKYLECLLTYLDIEVPRTHDLKTLTLLVPVAQDFPFEAAELGVLNPYAVDTRYDEDWREPHLADARTALDLAHRVRTAVREMIAFD